MSEVVMHRVDDRLVHGQVIVGWVGLRNINVIWIVDDEVVNNPMMLNIFKFAAPTGIKVLGMTIDEALEKLSHLAEGKDRILLLVKVPQTFVRLMELGYTPEEVNIGAMAHKANAIKVGPQTELSLEEAEAAEQLYKAGVHVWILLVPHGGQKVLEWKDARKKCGFE
jgi:PTS system mannose-specific IIB component